MGEIATRSRCRPTKGVRHSSPGDYRVMVVCRFDDADFVAVRRRAKANDRSFAAEVRALVKSALGKGASHA